MMGKYNALPTSRRLLSHTAKTQKGNTIMRMTGRPTEPVRTYEAVGVIKKETEKVIMIEIHELDGKELLYPKTDWYPRAQIAARVDQLDSIFTDFEIKKWILETNNFLDSVGEIKENLL